MLELAIPESRGRNNWLCNEHAADQFTQSGEDGMLAKIFDILGVEKGSCVELGAADGKYMSNTRRLITEKGWSAVMIEASDKLFAQLDACYADRDDVQCFHTRVSFEGENTLDNIFAQAGLPLDFDFFCLDVDGNDYHLWDSLFTYRPKLMVVEYNPTIPNEIVFVQPRNPSVTQGASLAALIQLGKEKGYELIATTELNGFFVLREDFHLFNIDDNCIDAMRSTSGTQSHLFQLYDGTLVLAGNKALMWQKGLPMRPERFQALPKAFRFVSPPTRLKKYGKRFWTWLYRKKLVG
jgi:hypothetical protein